MTLIILVIENNLTINTTRLRQNSINYYNQLLILRDVTVLAVLLNKVTVFTATAVRTLDYRILPYQPWLVIHVPGYIFETHLRH